MDQKFYEQDSTNEVEVDYIGILLFLKKHLFKIIFVGVLFAVCAGLFTHFLISEKYASSATIFVEPKIQEGTYSSNDFYANSYMVENYVVMLNGNHIQTKVANNLSLKVGDISSAVSCGIVDQSQIIKVSAVTTDASLSKKIVDEMLNVFISEMQESRGIDNISIVDNPTKSRYPVSPNLKLNVAAAAVLGMGMMCAFYVIKFLLDTHIHSREEAEKYFGLPTFGCVPYLK